MTDWLTTAQWDISAAYTVSFLWFWESKNFDKIRRTRHKNHNRLFWTKSQKLIIMNVCTLQRFLSFCSAEAQSIEHNLHTLMCSVSVVTVVFIHTMEDDHWSETEHISAWRWHSTFPGRKSSRNLAFSTIFHAFTGCFCAISRSISPRYRHNHAQTGGYDVAEMRHFANTSYHVSYYTS